MSYRIRIRNISSGASEEGDAIRQTSGNTGTPTTGEIKTSTVINMSEAQRNGLYTYIGLMQRGASTGAIETAITGAE